MPNQSFTVNAKDLTAQFSINIPCDGFEVAGELDLDCAIRAMGFDQNVPVGEIIVKRHDKQKPFTLEIVTLGEMKIKGLPNTEYEHTYVEEDPEYIAKHYDELHEKGLIVDSCWLTVKLKSPEPDPRDCLIEDFYVAQSIGQIVQDISLISVST